MGTCRMGASPDCSVADSKGQCWEVAGLYISDASCFPTSSGESQNCLGITSIWFPEAEFYLVKGFCLGTILGHFIAHSAG